MIITSQNAQLDVMVLIDLSGVNPVIQLTNLSTSDPSQSPLVPLDYLTWALNIASPDGTPIYTSDITAPFETGVWTNATITNAWPRPFNQIEWSGADYTIDFTILDNSTNKTYNLNKVATICPPTGLTKQQRDMFGRVSLVVETICERSSLYIQDKANKTYRGVIGITQASYLAVDYPRSPDGTLPTPFTITNFSSDALVPITFNAKGYHASYYTIIQYDLQDNVFLKLRYVAQSDFDVTCNADLCAVDCQITGLINEINSSSCDDLTEANRKLMIVSAKAHQAAIGIKYPSCGIDVPGLIAEIVSIGGYQCDCSSTSDGLGERSTVIDGVLYNVVIEGGDITGHFEKTDNNITLFISDKTYTFSICSDSHTSAFEVRPSTSGSNKNFCLYVNKNTLASEILTEISDDINLLNQLNNLVNTGSQVLISVDGGCVIETNPVGDYLWTLTGIPASGTFAALVSILANGTTKPLNYLFNQSNLSAFQNYLNTLGLGVFTVAYSGGTVTINSGANPNNFSALKYNAGSGVVIADQAVTNVGVQPIPVEQYIQAIILKFCALDDTMMVTSDDYQICYIDGNGNKQIETVSAGAELTSFIASLNAANCTTVDYIIKLKSASCDTIKTTFVSSTAPITATDFLLGTRNGSCARISPIELLAYAIKNIDATTLTLLCNTIIQCGAGKQCEPYDYLEAELLPHDTTCSYVVGIQGTWS